MNHPERGRGGLATLVLAAAVVLAVVGFAWWRDLLPGREDPEGEPPRVATPGRVGDLTLDRSAPARAFARDVQRELEAQVSGSTVRAATYGGPTGQVVVVTSVFPSGSMQAESLAADAGDAVRDYLGETGLEGLRAADAGRLEGALVCGHAPGQASLTCGWGDGRGVLLTARLATGELAAATVRDAAALTRRLVDAVVRPPTT